MKQTPAPTTTAVAVAQPQGGTALANIIPINSMEDVSRLGIAVAKSGWFGSITQSTGEMIAMTMLQERISPVTFKKKYHIMSDGSIATAARARVSAFIRLGGEMEIHEVTDEVCNITFRFGKNVLPCKVTLQEYIDKGIAVSSKTGALKDNWAKFSKDMLWARCCSSTIPKVCPQVDDGLYTAEEVADFDAAPAAPREPVKIDKSEVVSRLAKSAAPAPFAPAAAPAQPDEADVVEPVAIEMPPPAQKEKVAAATQPQPAVAPNPFAATNESTVCPIEGKFYNVPFTDMEPDILVYVLMPDTATRHPELTPAHIEAAKAAARAKGLEV